MHRWTIGALCALATTLALASSAIAAPSDQGLSHRNVCANAPAGYAHCHSKVTVGPNGKPVRTPARAALIVPSQALAEAIAEEWRGAADEIDPRAMPLIGLANAAIDHVTKDKAGFAGGLARYAEADLACYR